MIQIGMCPCPSFTNVPLGFALFYGSDSLIVVVYHHTDYYCYYYLFVPFDIVLQSERKAQQKKNKHFLWNLFRFVLLFSSFFFNLFESKTFICLRFNARINIIRHHNNCFSNSLHCDELHVSCELKNKISVNRKLSTCYELDIGNTVYEREQREGNDQ